VQARHRQAGHWGERSEPMLTSQKINYEIGGNVEATPYGGIFAMHRLVTRLGLVKAIDAALNLLKIHLPYHESDHVLTSPTACSPAVPVWRTWTGCATTCR
jgi:hypothetical protein